MDNNKNSEKEPSFDEVQAYEELRYIFQVAIENQYFEGLEERIAAWESKYPLDLFVDQDILRKIKALLNKDFLTRIVGDYLASQILHEKEKQKKAYEELHSIISSAKSTGDYKKAQKQVDKWKVSLRDQELSLLSFDRYYKSKVLTLLLIPSKEIANQEEATNAIKNLNSRKSSMDSESYSKELSDWQNKYPLANFPEKLQHELNELTIEALNSISQKKEAETAIQELQSLVASNEKSSTPLDFVSSVLAKYDYSNFDDESKSKVDELTSKYLSIALDLQDYSSEPIATNSPILDAQLSAINSLKDVLSKSSSNTDTILNWIYIYRKINFSQSAREEIINYFTTAGFKIPEQESYQMPEVDANIHSSDIQKIGELRQIAIINYLGILSKGNTLSTLEKENVEKLHTASATSEVIVEEPTTAIIIPVFDNIPENSNLNEIIAAPESEGISDIKIEDFLEESDASYTIPLPTTTALDTQDLKQQFEPQFKENISESAASEPKNEPVLKEQVPEHTVINQVTEPVIEEPEVIEQKPEEQNKKVQQLEPPKEDASSFTLTENDTKNLVNLQSISTYISVSIPILENIKSNKEKQEKKATKKKIFDSLQRA